LNWDIEYYINEALKNKHKECLSQRIFPVINSDLSVNVCHLYKSFKIHNNFLKIEWQRLKEKRANNNYCKICQKYGLHRLDLHILKEKNGS